MKVGKYLTILNLLKPYNSITGNVKQIIHHLNADMDRLSSKITKYPAKEIDFNIRTAVFIMIMLTISVCIIFVLFLKAKIMFRSYK